MFGEPLLNPCRISVRYLRSLDHSIQSATCIFVPGQAMCNPSNELRAGQQPGKQVVQQAQDI